MFFFYSIMLHKVCTILGLLFRKREWYDEASSENAVLKGKEISLILKIKQEVYL